MSIVSWVFGVGAMATALAISGPAAQAQSTLATVKKRGELVCGVNGSLPAFSYLDDKKERVGFDAEYCRAVAAAVLGDAKKVKFVPLPIAKRFEALKSGEIDLLVGAVAELVGIECGVVSGVFNLELSGIEVPDWRPRHGKHYHEA